eukprot:ctg_778.g329
MDAEGMSVVPGAAEEIRTTAIDPTTAAPAPRPNTSSSRERRPTVLQTVGEHGQIYRLTNGSVKYRGATLLVLQCPEAYCSEAALRGHFEAVVPGQVERVEVRPAKRSALVHFRSQAAAATALRRGHTTGDQVALRLRYFIPLAARQALRRHQQGDRGVEEESREHTPEPTSIHTPPPPPARSETAAAPSTTTRRARPRSATAPDETAPLVGTCQDMCPEEERRAREWQRDLHPFEITSDAQGVPHADPHKTVKKFARSAAGAEAVRAENVRTPATLVRTMDYLMHRVLDRDDHPPGLYVPGPARCPLRGGARARRPLPHPVRASTRRHRPGAVLLETEPGAAGQVSGGAATHVPGGAPARHAVCAHRGRIPRLPPVDAHRGGSSGGVVSRAAVVGAEQRARAMGIAGGAGDARKRFCGVLRAPVASGDVFASVPHGATLWEHAIARAVVPGARTGAQRGRPRRRVGAMAGAGRRGAGDGVSAASRRDRRTHTRCGGLDRRHRCDGGGGGARCRRALGADAIGAACRRQGRRSASQRR